VSRFSHRDTFASMSKQCILPYQIVSRFKPIMTRFSL